MAYIKYEHVVKCQNLDIIKEIKISNFDKKKNYLIYLKTCMNLI